MGRANANILSFDKQMVIDVRNMYEIRIGKFKRAIDPCTNAFREFPTWVDEQFDIEISKESETTSTDNGTHMQSQNGIEKSLPRVAMYCTGGIRCEKASSFLLSKGFKEVLMQFSFLFFCISIVRKYFSSFSVLICGTPMIVLL
jgi:predicted sulfurtransferase